MKLIELNEVKMLRSKNLVVQILCGKSKVIRMAEDTFEIVIN